MAEVATQVGWFISAAAGVTGVIAVGLWRAMRGVESQGRPTTKNPDAVIASVDGAVHRFTLRAESQA